MDPAATTGKLADSKVHLHPTQTSTAVTKTTPHPRARDAAAEVRFPWGSRRCNLAYHVKVVHELN